jgi:hypothetical protein
MKIPYLYGCLVVVEWVGLSPKKVGEREWDAFVIGKAFGTENTHSFLGLMC